jgi:hypothetical protein
LAAKTVSLPQIDQQKRLTTMTNRCKAARASGANDLKFYWKSWKFRKFSLLFIGAISSNECGAGGNIDSPLSIV